MRSVLRLSATMTAFTPSARRCSITLPMTAASLCTIVTAQIASVVRAVTSVALHELGMASSQGGCCSCSRRESPVEPGI